MRDYTKWPTDRLEKYAAELRASIDRLAAARSAHGAHRTILTEVERILAARALLAGEQEGGGAMRELTAEAQELGLGYGDDE